LRLREKRTAYVETDPVKTEASVLADLVSGEHDHPIEVVAFSVAEGWARDVSEDIARAVVDRARSEGRRLPEGTRDFGAAPGRRAGA
jgi:hypothetical protein